MFSKKKEPTQIDAEQREMYEYARKRIIQKKRLFQHFIFFLVGSIFMIVLNLILGLGKDIKVFGLDWFVIAILCWSFLLLIHICNVWIFSNFMGKEWTDRQMERLILKQKERISKMQNEIDVKNTIETPLKNNGTLIRENKGSNTELL